MTTPIRPHDAADPEPAGFRCPTRATAVSESSGPTTPQDKAMTRGSSNLSAPAGKSGVRTAGASRGRVA